MKQVFVSYTSADRPVAEDLVAFLESHGIECYIAPRDVAGGKPYASEIVDAISGCQVVLLLASSNINNSVHVLNEVDVIIEKKKILMPVFIEDFELNDEYRYYLGRQHRILAYEDDVKKHYQKILDEVTGRLPKKPSAKDILRAEEADVQDSKKTTVFEYYPDRGIMINPEDHQRNVSFRTDTLINMLGGIFDEVKKLSESDAERIFFESGYDSGKNFAERIESQWNAGHTFEDIKLKFEKWCKFDSAVGWGRFSYELNLDEKNDCINGSVCINEAFIVDNRKKRKVCSFIKGYCDGVIETFLNSTEIELTCRECPLRSTFKTSCVFDFKTK